jgi:CheY-like chemotaxis protein
MNNTDETRTPQGCVPAGALVVENDPWIRLVMRDLLAQSGYRVAEASNGFSGLRLAQREPLALVLLDLVLPEQSGLSVLAELRAAPATAHGPAIVIGGHPQVLRDVVTRADAVIAAAHRLRSARESPGNGDGFSPGCGQVLVRGYGPHVIGNNVYCYRGPAGGG